MKKIFLISLFVLLLPLAIFAQSHGFVPCGGEGQPACQLCHFFVLIKNIIDFIFKIVLALAALMFVIGGFAFLTSTGNPGRTETGKKIVTATVIGLAIVFGSWLIINSILTFPNFVNPNFNLGNWYDPGSWFQANCP